MDKKPTTVEEWGEACRSVYPGGAKKKPRGASLQIWEKVIKKVSKEEDIDPMMLAEKIFSYLIAYNKSVQNDKTYNPTYERMFTTWLNQYGWDDEIESKMDGKAAVPQQACKCGQPAGKQGICMQCLCKASRRAENDNVLKGINKMGLVQGPTESKEIFRKRCAIYCKNNIKSLIKRMVKS